MAQVSLYVDDETMEYLREQSKSEGTSVSKFVGKVIKGYKDDHKGGWPEGWLDRVYGCAPDFPDVGNEGIDDSLDDACDWWVEA